MTVDMTFILNLRAAGRTSPVFMQPILPDAVGLVTLVLPD